MALGCVSVTETRAQGLAPEQAAVGDRSSCPGRPPSAEASSPLRKPSSGADAPASCSSVCLHLRSRLGHGVSWSLCEAQVGLAHPRVEGTAQCTVLWGVAGPSSCGPKPRVTIRFTLVPHYSSRDDFKPGRSVCCCGVGNTCARVILCAFKKDRLTSKTYMNFVFLKHVDWNMCGLVFKRHHAVS